MHGFIEVANNICSIKNQLIEKNYVSIKNELLIQERITKAIYVIRGKK